jgi:NAD kinase
MRPERLIIVTRETRLEELKQRFVTLEQARFYLDRAGQDLGPLEEEHKRFERALQAVRGGVPDDLPVQMVRRGLVSSFPFRDSDLVVTIGPDGLVANTVKYALGIPIIAINPDPDTIEGVLCRTEPGDFGHVLKRSLADRADQKAVTLAEAATSDGQKLLAVNDLFIGRKDHVSARYQIEAEGRAEHHSSSGIVVSTGVGSTGWMRSIVQGAYRTASVWGASVTIPESRQARIPWDADSLFYFVREPFPSVGLGTDLTTGNIPSGSSLSVTSEMAQGGVIFSDGVAEDAIAFHSGLTAHITLSAQRGLIVGG